MADYTQSQYDRMIENPAAPTGLKQTASRWEQASERSVYGPQTIGEDAQSWYGGRNTQGIESGFDNEFMRRSFESYDAWQTKVMESRRSEDPDDWLNPWDWLNPEKNDGDATGVALWDDPMNKFKRGDVVEDGEVRPNQNVYEVFGRHEADLLLGDFLLDKDTKARIFKRSDSEEALAREVETQTDRWTEQAAASPAALEYAGDVYEQRNEGWVSDWRGQLATFVSGFTGGAAIGGTAGGVSGSIVPGAGTLAGTVFGGITGGVLGGVGALMNQDVVLEQIAVGNVQAERARSKYGSDMFLASQLKHWSGVGMKGVSPVSNYVQGGADVWYGDVGDGTAEFYAVDENGDRVVHGLWQAADVGAALADGLLQFSTPGGRIGYMTTTGGLVAGQVGELTLTALRDGDSVAGFNERTGQWQEYEGAGQVVAAMGVVGIDAIQMGVAGALGKASTRAHKVFDPARAGRVRETQILDGHKFKFDKDGTLIGRSVAISSLIAPSEALRFVTVSWRARGLANKMEGALPAAAAGRYVDPDTAAKVRAAVAGGGQKAGMVTPDHYYEAAMELAHGSVLRSAIVNGWAEGAEEGVQAILEPLSFSEQIDGMEVGRSIMYGMASGVGMGLGKLNEPVSFDQRQEYRAKSLWLLRQQIPEPQDQQGREDLEGEWREIWGQASAAEKKRMATIARDEVDRVNEIMGVYKELHTHNAQGSQIAYSAINAARTAKYEELHKNRNRNVDGTRVLMGRGDGGPMVAAGGYVDPTTYIEDASVQSVNQVKKDLEDLGNGLEEQIDALERRVADLQDDLVSEQDGDRKITLQAEIDELVAMQADLPLALELSQEIVARVESYRQQYYQTTSMADKSNIIASLNNMLLEAHDNRYRNANNAAVPDNVRAAAKRAVEVRMVRYPGLDAGANTLLLPQASVVLTELKQEATSYIHQSKLAAMNADHDGDQGVTNNAQVIPVSSLLQLRRGAQYLDSISAAAWEKEYGGLPDTAVEGDRRNYVRVKIDRPDGHKTRVEIAQDALRDKSANGVRRDIVVKAVESLADEFKTRYSKTFKVLSNVQQMELSNLLLQLEKDMESGSKVGEQKFLDSLWNTFTVELLNLADETNQAEMLWQQGRLERMWVEIQTSLAAQAGQDADRVSSGAPQTPPEESRYMEGVSRQDAASLGGTLQTLVDSQVSGLRQGQAMHYAPWYTSSVDAGRMAREGHQDSVRFQEFQEMYANLGSGAFQPALTDVVEANRIEARTLYMLRQVLAEARRAYPEIPELQTDHGLILVAMSGTVDIEITGPNQYRVNPAKNTTVLQLLLQKSLEIEKRETADAREDSDIAKKIKRLEQLTRSKDKDDGHSVAAKRAMFEIFADVPMWELAGRDSLGIGANLTPRQLAMSVAQMDTMTRGTQADKWRHLPAYLDPHGKKHDPPYFLAEYMEGSTNSLTLMVDSIIAEANSAPKDMRKKDDRASQKFLQFHRKLQDMLADHEKRHQERLRKQGLAEKDGSLSKATVFRDMLATQPDLATVIAELIPAEAQMGVFSRRDGQVWTAAWFEQMLLHDKAEKAELMLFVHSKLAELNAHGGQLIYTDEVKDDHKKRLKLWRKKGKKGKRPRLDDPVRGIKNPGAIKSRFNQAIYRLVMEDPTGFELERLLDMAEQSESREDFFDKFNKEPNWTGGQAEFFMYFDSMDTWEEDLSKTWSTGGGSAQLQREALDKAAIRVSMLSQQLAEADASATADMVLLDNMETYLTAPGTQALGGENAIKQLRHARTLAQTYPDTVGYAARDQFLEMVQVGVPVAHEKGKPNEAVRPMGANLMTQSSLDGYSSGFSQEMAALTSHDWKKVMANLTGLAQGPVRVMFRDGRYRVIDFNDDLTVVRMLKDPMTRDFAKAVLFPTTRDVDKNNNMQQFRTTSTASKDTLDAPLVTLLNDTALGHLFPKRKLGSLDRRQATQIIGMLESNMRQLAIEGGKEDREAADNPLTKWLGDFLIAYTHAPEGGKEKRRGQSERDYVLTEAMTAVTYMATLSPAQRTELRKWLEEKLLGDQQRHLRTWTFSGLGEDGATALDGLITTHLHDQYTAQRDAVEDQITQTEDVITQLMASGAPQADIKVQQDLIDDLTDQWNAVDDKITELANQKPLWERIKALHPTVQSALNRWTQRINDQSDPNLAANRKSLIDYLNTGTRVNALVEKDLYRLDDKVRKAVYEDPAALLDDKKITPEEWMLLGSLAGTYAVQESAGYIASSKGMVGIKEPDASSAVARYYDPTWSYLLDTLFDPTVLEAAKRLVVDQGMFKQLGVSYDKIGEKIYRSLLSEKRLGRWTPLVVAQSITARKVLDGGSGEGAVQSEGMAPTEQQAAVAASMVTYTKPDPAHVDTATVRIESRPDHAGSFQQAIEADDPLLYMKLDRHFVDQVTVTLPNGKTVDLKDATTEVYMREESVATSGYTILRTDLLDERLDELRQIHGSGNYDVSIGYVNVDKKPHEPEHVNSIYYDGVGRESAYSTGPGVIAEMIFSTGGLSKMGQQLPLDFASKAGAAFWQQKISNYKSVKTTEESRTLAELIGLKTREAFTLDYFTGPLLLGDQNAIYKLMKMRHIVKGVDPATGELRFMWAEEVISREANNEKVLGGMKTTANPQGYEVIPLSDPVLVALLGRPGTSGDGRALTMPEMNLLDVDPFPKLTLTRMAELGLSRLGEQAKINDTVFAQVGALSVATLQTDGRGAARVTPYEMDIEFWHQHQSRIDQGRNSAEKDLKVRGRKGSRNVNKGILADMTRSEKVVEAMSKLRIPFETMRDFAALILEDSLTKRINDIMGPGNFRMIWVHEHGASFDAKAARLGKTATDNDFADVKLNGLSVAPTYRDVVVIDLDTIWNANSAASMDQMADEAMKAFRAYAKYGATVVLGGKVAQQLRGEVAQRIRDDGGTRYRPMKGSSHFFAPTAMDPDSSQNIEALESLSTEVRYVRADEAQYRFVSDYIGVYASENSVLLDYEHASTFKFKRIINTLIPSALTSYDPDTGRSMWNLPYRGTGPNDQQAILKERLLPKLDDKRVVEALKAMSEGKKPDEKGKFPDPTNEGNPKDVALLEFDTDGKVATEGVLSFDDALKRFKEQLRSNTDPLAVGRTLLPGDFYMVVRQDQTPMLLRYGFQIPDQQKLQQQLDAVVGDGDAERRLEVGIGVSKLQAEQTVPPPMRIRKVRRDKMGVKLEGDFDISVMTKGMVQGTGYKAGYRPMPAGMQAPTQPMSRTNNTWISSYVAEQSIDSKEARRGMINNLREAFVLTGVDFRQDMVDYFFGESSYSSEAEMLDLWGLYVEPLLNKWSEEYTNISIQEAAALLDIRGTVQMAQEYFNTALDQILPAGAPALRLDQQIGADAQDRTARIGNIIMTTLMLPDMTPAHIIGTPGMLSITDKHSDARIVEMPSFMTDALADPNFPSTRNEMFRRINANAQWPTVDVNGVQKYEYYINPDFSVEVFMRDENGNPLLVKGKLQRITEIPYEKEAASISAAALKQKQDASEHTVNVAAETIGAWSVIGKMGKEYEVNPLEALLEGKNEILYFTEEGDSFHELFSRVKGSMKDYQPWDRKLPFQQLYRSEALAKVAQYRDPISKKGWGQDHTVAAEKFLRKLNLDNNQMYEVDRLVRQWLGAPGARGAETEYEIGEGDYVQAVTMMLGNLNEGMQPLMGAMVPMPDESFWAKVFKAQQGRDKGKWQPHMRSSWKDKFTKKAKSWDDWNVALMGQVRSSTVEFNHMFRMDTDGFMHTYLSSSTTFADLPISLDLKRDMELMDPDANHYMLSLDPGTDAFFSNPIVLETMDFTLETLTGHQTDIITQRDARATPSSTIAQRIEQQKKWLAGKKVATQKQQSYRDYYREGASFMESSSRTHNFFLNLNHLQIMNRLAVPALYFSAVLETWVKTKFEVLSDIAGGRAVTRRQANVGRMFGVRPTYTQQELAKLEGLAKHMGSQTEWRAMLYGEMLYKDLIRRGAPNTTSQLIEKGASTMARVTSDPRLGMNGTPAAKRYVAAAMEWLDTTDNNITVDQFVRALSVDPLWLQKNFPADRTNPHTVGINAIAQTRGTKQSYINKRALGFADNWERSDVWGLQLMGFLINVPFRFKRFNVGTFLSMTGLGGFDTMFAMMKDGKPKTTLAGRMQAAMRGEAYQPTEAVDNSDILQSVDLTREMSKGAMTQTTLLALGMFAGSLDLDGEDEESRKRRLRAEYLQGPYLYDPRKMENDFLYADALFVDNLGPLSTMFMDEGTERAVIEPHWIVQQFTSPVMGIQKFFRTGNPREIWDGFGNAIAAIPTSALNILRDAQEAASILVKEADQLAEEGEDVGAMQDRVTQMIINIGSVYEKALFENQFINSVRTAGDRFDRDPYAIAATDESGEIQRLDGEPLRSEDLEQYGERDEEGELTGETGEAYVSRPMEGMEGARSVAYAENNLMYAIAASLITGNLFSGNSPFFRKNMPVKQRKVEVPEVGQADAEQLLLAALADVGTEEAISLNEMTYIIKGEYERADVRWVQHEVEAEAQARIDAMAMDGRPGGLFELGADNNIVIQHEGARGIYKGLWSDQLQWDDDVMLTSLPPIPYETRAAIATEWAEELIQRGVDMGMSQQGAEFYARRVYYGDKMDDDSIAIADIIFDDRIPYSGTYKYNQLNMMYTIGPDGRPWATPFKKNSFLQALGIPLPHTVPETGTGMGVDERGKSVDEVQNINTGLHGLERLITPAAKDFDPFETAANKTYVPGADKDAAKYGSKWRTYPRSGYSSGGYSSGGGYYDTPDMRALPRGAAPRLNGIPAINADRPFIRRARVNRNRITTQRGRLKQWQ